MENIVTYKTKEINSLTTITVDIEKTWFDNYSVLVQNVIEGGLWIEKFADTFEDAQILADKLFIKACKQYK